jgi:hypothetical protein
MKNVNIGGTDRDWDDYWIRLKLESNQRDLFDKNITPVDPEEQKRLSEQYNIIEKSTKHLNDSNMSYWYHFRHSASNGNKLFLYALSSYAHAILPGKLKQHAARGIITMYEGMKQWPHLRRAMHEISNKIDRAKM